MTPRIPDDVGGDDSGDGAPEAGTAPRGGGRVALAARAGAGVALALGALAAAAVPAPAQEAPPLVLANATLVDGTGSGPRPGTWITVAGGEIRGISTGPVDAPAGARVLDLEGRYVLPGLIDAHVHISSLEHAERALASGVTTARSAGVPHFVDVGLRRLGASGLAEIPEILAAGYHVRPGLDEGLFLDEPGLAPLLERGLASAADVRRVVRALVERGVDQIKTNATARAGTPDTDPREPILTQEQLDAAVEEAESAGLPVMTHAHGDEGARRAVRAGVRSIEHGTYLSEETLSLMRERGTFLVPTIAVVVDLTRPGGSYDDPFLQIRGRHMLTRVRRSARRAHEMGVPIVAATDTGYDPGSVVRIGHELEELVNVGLTPMEAIRAATTRAAELLGVDDHTGRVEEGLDADLVVVDGDPLEDIQLVQDVVVVVNDGRLVVNRVEW